MDAVVRKRCRRATPRSARSRPATTSCCIRRTTRRRWRRSRRRSSGARSRPAQVDASVRRILRAKARLGLHRTRIVSLDDVPKPVGGRAARAVARDGQPEVDHADQGRSQSGAAARAARGVGAVSVGARLSVGLAHRRAEPDVHSRAARSAGRTSRRSSCRIDRRPKRSIWCARRRRATTRSSSRSSCARRRAAAGMDLAPPLAKLLSDLARATAGTPKPFVTMFFGNPYVPMLACPTCRRCC